MDNKEETKIVKETLEKAGINALVGHGRGTASGWLHINIGSGQNFPNHEKPEDGGLCSVTCARCETMRAMSRKAVQIAQDVTGRRGDYNGEINIYCQDRWDAKLCHSVPISQNPNWRP